MKFNFIKAIFDKMVDKKVQQRLDAIAEEERIDKESDEAIRFVMETLAERGVL